MGAKQKHAKMMIVDEMDPSIDIYGKNAAMVKIIYQIYGCENKSPKIGDSGIFYMGNENHRLDDHVSRYSTLTLSGFWQTTSWSTSKASANKKRKNYLI